MPTFRIHHITTYRYARPVMLQQHRLMFRPRGSHDMRLLDSRLTISPPSANLLWSHDVFGNSIALADFGLQASELRFESELLIEHFAAAPEEWAIAPHARTFPFSYDAEEVADLGRTDQRHYPDPEHMVDNWAKGFLARAIGPDGLVETLPLLVRMTESIKRDFVYQAREAEGTQSPTQTLQSGSGTCRDYALLMMEAVRSLGLAARFVSGYLYDPSVDGAAVGTLGAGATHAWVQVYLPGAGWIEFDPTNGIIGGRSLIRVAVSRDPAQAVPVSGQWFGAPSDFLGMSVEVTVTSEGPATRSLAA